MVVSPGLQLTRPLSTARECSAVGMGQQAGIPWMSQRQELWARWASYTTPNSLETLPSSFSREPQGSISQGETAFFHFVRVPLATDPPRYSFPEDSTTTVEVSLLTVQCPCQRCAPYSSPTPSSSQQSFKVGQLDSETLNPTTQFQEFSLLFIILAQKLVQTVRSIGSVCSIPSSYTSKEKDALSQPLEYK